MMQLLCKCALCNPQGQITEEGRRMARLGVHPRFAHMVVQGQALGCAELACLLASLLSERDVLRGSSAVRTANISVRLQALAAAAGVEAEVPWNTAVPDRSLLSALDRAGAARVLQGARNMMRQLDWSPLATGDGVVSSDGDDGEEDAAGEEDGVDVMSSSVEADGDGAAGSAIDEMAVARQTSNSQASTSGSGGSGKPRPGIPSGTSNKSFDQLWVAQCARDGLVGALVSLAYPDRIAVRKDRSNKRASFGLSSGRVVRLPIEDDPLGGAALEFLAIAELGGNVAPGREDQNDNIYMAAPLSATAVDRYLKHLVTERQVRGGLAYIYYISDILCLYI